MGWRVRANGGSSVRTARRRSLGWWLQWASMLGLAWWTFGCDSERTKACKQQFARAQTLVTKVKADSMDSVQSGVNAVDEAVKACKAAGQDGETEQLIKGKAKLDAHLKWLHERPPERKPLTPDQQEQLAKNGDPNCPKGQAYKYQGQGPEIRCTGGQPVDFAWKQAEAYYTDRNYKIRSGDKPGTLSAEYGAEKLVFHYDGEGSSSPATCLLYFPPPSISWQEAVSRLTGVGPHRLKQRDGAVKPSGRSVPYHVEEDERKLVVELGACQGKL